MLTSFDMDAKVLLWHQSSQRSKSSQIRSYHQMRVGNQFDKEANDGVNILEDNCFTCKNMQIQSLNN